MQSRCLLLIGGTGFVGTRLLRHLKESGRQFDRVVVLSRRGNFFGNGGNNGQEEAVVEQEAGNSPRLENGPNSTGFSGTLDSNPKYFVGEKLDLVEDEAAATKLAHLLRRHGVTDCVHAVGSLLPDPSYKTAKRAPVGLESVLNLGWHLARNNRFADGNNGGAERLRRLRRINTRSRKLLLDGNPDLAQLKLSAVQTVLEAVQLWHKDGEQNQLQTLTYLSADYNPCLAAFLGGEYWQSKYEAEQMLMQPEFRAMIQRRIILRPGLIRDGELLNAAIGPLVSRLLADRIPGTIDLDQLCHALLNEIQQDFTPIEGEAGIRRLHTNHLARQ